MQSGNSPNNPWDGGTARVLETIAIPPFFGTAKSRRSRPPTRTCGIHLSRSAEIPRARNWPLTVSAIRSLRDRGCIGFSVVAELVRCTDRENSDRKFGNVRRSHLACVGDCHGDFKSSMEICDQCVHPSLHRLVGFETVRTWPDRSHARILSLTSMITLSPYG